MKKIVLTVKTKPTAIIKETAEERAARVRTNFTYTRVAESKKKYNRKKLKKVEF